MSARDDEVCVERLAQRRQDPADRFVEYRGEVVGRETVAEHRSDLEHLKSLCRVMTSAGPKG
jgi:hypothetical protein